MRRKMHSIVSLWNTQQWAPSSQDGRARTCAVQRTKRKDPRTNIYGLSLKLAR